MEELIKQLAEKAAQNALTAPEAQQYAQAALNVAHALQVLEQVKKTREA